jgi:YidC/Oxa1 family membrane protein insertase
MNDIIVGLLAVLAHSFGGSPGWAILVLSLCVRVALLPLTIKLARRTRRNQETMRALQPEIEQLKKRFEKKPERLFEEMSKLYRKHDCSPFDLPTLIGSFVQLPVFGILYSSIRSSITASSSFLWIRNLASPDLLLTLAVLALAGISAYWMPATAGQRRSTLVLIQVVITLVFIWRLAAGLSLYWVSSNAVGIFQAVWLRYRDDSASKRFAICADR